MLTDLSRRSSYADSMFSVRSNSNINRDHNYVPQRKYSNRLKIPENYGQSLPAVKKEIKKTLSSTSSQSRQSHIVQVNEVNIRYTNLDDIEIYRF